MHEAQIATAFVILGLEPGKLFDNAKVESAYRRLVRTVHPDVCKGPEAARLFDLVTQARNLLIRTKPVLKPEPVSTSFYTASWASSSVY